MGQQERSQAVLVCKLTQGWKPTKAPLKPSGGSLSYSPWPLLTKLGESDNTEAYLDAFERTTEAAKWPKERRAFFIGPYLPGETLTSLKALEKAEAAVYQQLKWDMK